MYKLCVTIKLCKLERLANSSNTLVKKQQYSKETCYILSFIDFSLKIVFIL